MKGPGLVGRAVVLCQQSSTHFVDNACTPVDRTRTTEDGHFTLSVTPRENSLYTVVVPATPQMLGNASRVITALVSPQPTSRLRRPNGTTRGRWSGAAR